jgi:hypothetical protein
MNMDHLPRELARLERMTIPELRRRYLEVFGEESIRGPIVNVGFTIGCRKSRERNLCLSG